MKTSAGRGVLRAAAFTNSSASVFLDRSMYSMVKPLKWLSILLARVRYLSRVGSLAMHSFDLPSDYFGVCVEGASLDPDGS
jgi:hypothetical protein